MSFCASREGKVLILDNKRNTDLPCSAPITEKEEQGFYFSKSNYTISKRQQSSFFHSQQAFRLKSKVTSSAVTSSSCDFSSSNAWPIRCSACVIKELILLLHLYWEIDLGREKSECHLYPLDHGFRPVCWTVLCSSLQDVSQDVDHYVTAEELHYIRKFWTKGWGHRRTKSWAQTQAGAMLLEPMKLPTNLQKTETFGDRVEGQSPLSLPSWALLFFWDSSAWKKCNITN